MIPQEFLSTRIAILILNWNGKTLLEKYLPSVLNLDHPNLTVYVIDNGSVDESVEFLTEAFPTVQVISLNENLGFAPAYNKVFVEDTIDADVFILLNNDVEVRTDWLFELVMPLLEDKDIGVAGSKLYFADGKTLQHAGATLDYPRANGQHRFYRELDVGQADDVCDVDYVTGASIAVHRRVLDKIGLFDAAFAPMYFEEADFCYRTKQAGFRVVYVPSSVAIHYESMSIRQDIPKLSYNLNRNRLYFVLKHYTPQQFFDEFVPAEKQYVSQMMDPTQRQVMREIYFEMLWLLPVKQSEFDHAISVKAYQNEMLALAQTAVSSPNATSPPQRLTEFTFTSATGKIRQAWHDIAGKWALRHLVQQQNGVNLQLFKQAEALAQQNEIRASEINTLVKEIAILKTRISLLENAKMEDGDDV